MKILFFKYIFSLLLFLFFGNNCFSNSGNLLEEDIIIPDFTYILQRPSYIKLEEEGKNIYLCDEEKEECKVNFKLVDEDEKDISSKYICEIITDFEIGEEKYKCNPNTIIIPENSEQKIIFKMFDKNNLENFIKKEIVIKNLFDNSDIPDFKYLLQSPSYVDEISENNLECDSTKDECKINFKFVTLEEKDISSKYICEIITDFDIGEEKNKCNPNTIIIPQDSDKIIKIKISEKNNLENFIEKEIFIDNTIIHYLPSLKIQVQGRISKYKKIGLSSMICLTYSKCSINFTSGYTVNGIYYKWIFGNGEKYYGSNPKTQKFSPGFYLVKLITSDKFGNRKVEHYRITVKKLFKKSEQKKFKTNFEKIVKYKKTIYSNLNKNIEIALKNENNKNNFLVKNINETLINIKKTNTKISKKLKIKNIKKNISKKLTVKNIFGKGIKDKKITKIKKLTKPKEYDKKKELKKAEKLRIKAEKAKIKLLRKNIKLNISFQKKALKISGKTFPKSKVEIKIGENTFSKISLNNGKYVFKIKKLIPGKYNILATTFNKSGEIIAQKKSSEKIITQSYINKVKSYLYKKPKKSKKRKKYIKKSKYKKFIISKLSNNYNKNLKIKSEKLNLKIFFLNTLIALFGFTLLYIILVRKKML